MHLKLNLKVRMRNPVFWLTFLPAAVGFVYSVLSVFGVVPGISQKSIVNILSEIITALATVGVLIDPTTKGVCDSEDALKYEEPK